MCRRFSIRLLLMAGLLLVGITPAVAFASPDGGNPAVRSLSIQGAQAVEALPMRVVTTARYSSGGYVHVDGILANDGTRALNFPQVSITLKDGGTVLGTFSGSAYGYRVGPGEQVAFGHRFLAVGVDASTLTAVVTATGISEVDPLPIVMTEVSRSYAPSGGLRMYKTVFRNDSAYYVEGPTLSGWELDANGGLLGTLYAHEWALIPPGGTIAIDFTGYSPFALPASVPLRCEARTLGVAAPTTSISGVPVGWSRTNVTFTLTSSDAAAKPYYDLGSGLVPYVAPVTISAEGKTTVEYLSINGGVRSPSYSALVAIDKTAPRTISNAKASYRRSAIITLTPRDSLSGVRDTRYRVDSGSWRVGTRVAVTSLGRHVLRFYSRDRAGNVETVRTVYFTVTR